MAEENVEIRRAAIESFGWPEFTRAAGLSLIASEPDPGNEGQTLHLYDAPEDLTGVPARVLVMTNGTVERDGTRRQYGEMVPSDVSRPSEGAAWRTGLSHSDYMTLCHRT